LHEVRAIIINTQLFRYQLTIISEQYYVLKNLPSV